jgi:predicted nucleic acid-binding protein
VKYVLDTNLYIEASRSDEAADALNAFQQRSLPRIHLHSVVAQELLAGAVRPDVERRLLTKLVRPVETVGRVITPTHRTWTRAGQIIAQLVREKRLSPGGVARSFVNDCLLAASAREHGFVLVTRNVADFELIRSVEALEVAAPWPERPQP